MNRGRREGAARRVSNFLTMRGFLTPALTMLLLSLATGCGSYRVLSEAKAGGTVVLEGTHDRAREKAEGYMRAHCPAGYVVVEEGEATAQAGDVREWRIAYACAQETRIGANAMAF